MTRHHWNRSEAALHPRPGDVVMAYTPDRRTPDEPGKFARPCVVVWSRTNKGNLELELAPGKPAAGRGDARPTDLTLDKRRERKAAGVDGAWRFDMADRVKIPWTRGYASLQSQGKPVGQLEADAFSRAQKAYGAAKRAESRRAEMRRDNARRKQADAAR